MQSESSGSQKGVTGTYLSDFRSGFLFVPAILLSRTEGNAPRPPTFDLNAKNEAGISSDVAFTQAIAEPLCALTDSEVFESSPDALQNKPKQVYVILRSGVTRLCESAMDPNADSQHAYYSNEFPATTLFQDRPYFEPTLKKATEEKNAVSIDVNRYFYATKPYIDLGGNGFVKTFCRAIQPTVENGVKRELSPPDAIVCLDFILGNNIVKTIREQIEHFRGSTMRVHCTESGCIPAPETPSFTSMLRQALGLDRLDNDDIGRLNQVVADLRQKRQLSDLFGKIYVHSQQDDPEQKFTIPIGHFADITTSPQSGRHAALLLCDLNLQAYGRFCSILAGLAGGCLFVCFVTIALIFADYGIRLREQHRAFATVDSVMERVPVAYARLDEDGRIFQFNEALARLLGFNSKDAAFPALNGKQWVDLLVDDTSRTAFRDNKQARKTGSAPAYRVSIWKQGKHDHSVCIDVHAADVPEPSTSRAKVGASFGFLLPVAAAADPKVVMMPPAACG